MLDTPRVIFRVFNSGVIQQIIKSFFFLQQIKHLQRSYNFQIDVTDFPLIIMLYLWLCIMTFNKIQVITSKIVRSPPLWNISFTNDHGYDPLVLNTSLSFPHTRLITGFVTILTWRVELVKQGLLTLSDHLSSPLVFSGVRVTRYLVLYVCFVDRCLSFCTIKPLHCLSFCHFLASDYLFGIFKLFLLSCSRINIWNDTGIESIICPVLHVWTETSAYIAIYMLYLNAINTPNNFDQEDFQPKNLQ